MAALKIPAGDNAMDQRSYSKRPAAAIEDAQNASVDPSGVSSKRQTATDRSRSTSPGSVGMEDQVAAAKERLAISDFLTKRKFVGAGDQLATTPGTSSGRLSDGDGEGWSLAVAGNAQMTYDRLSLIHI